MFQPDEKAPKAPRGQFSILAAPAGGVENRSQGTNVVFYFVLYILFDHNRLSGAPEAFEPQPTLPTRLEHAVPMVPNVGWLDA